MDKTRWHKDILTDQGIENLFKEVKINDHKYIGIDSCYTFNDNQHGV